MLARPIEQTGSDVGQPQAGTTAEVHASAFGRAQRHSRRVRVLKLVLPLAAAIMALGFPIYSYLASPTSVPVEADGSAYSDGKLVMANPRLDGLTDKNLPYSLSALRAIQNADNENIVELEGIGAKLPVTAGNVATIAASHGIYDREMNTLDLDREITVSTTDGVAAKFKSVFLDMGKGTMKTSEPVDILRGGSRITADTMTAQDSGKVLVFENRVRLNIDPAQAKAAKEQSGE